METLTYSRYNGIRTMLETGNTLRSIDVLSYNDLLFLSIIEMIGLTGYSTRIQKQLNNIRNKYMINKQNGGVKITGFQNQYTVTDPFKIAVICENGKDFHTEITKKLRGTFTINRIQPAKKVLVNDMFVFIKIHTQESSCGEKLDGYLETPRSYVNKHYNDIISTLYPCFY